MATYKAIWKSLSDLKNEMADSAYGLGNYTLARALRYCETEEDIVKTYWQSYGVGAERWRDNWKKVVDNIEESIIK